MVTISGISFDKSCLTDTCTKISLLLKIGQAKGVQNIPIIKEGDDITYYKLNTLCYVVGDYKNQKGASDTLKNSNAVIYRIEEQGLFRLKKSSNGFTKYISYPAFEQHILPLISGQLVDLIKHSLTVTGQATLAGSEIASAIAESNRDNIASCSNTAIQAVASEYKAEVEHEMVDENMISPKVLSAAIKQKNRELTNLYQGTGCVYIGTVDSQSDESQPIIKCGYTDKNLIQRTNEHEQNFECFHLQHVIESHQPKRLESLIHNLPICQARKIEVVMKNGTISRECFQGDDELTPNIMYREGVKLNRTLATMEPSVNGLEMLEIEKEKTKQKAEETKQKAEETKQKAEETKQKVADVKQKAEETKQKLKHDEVILKMLEKGVDPKLMEMYMSKIG